MQSRRVTDIAGYLDPASEAWGREPVEIVDMIPAPLGLQPNDYIIQSWTDRPYGEVERVDLSSVHDGDKIAVRMTWASKTIGTGSGEGFPDSAAIAFPVRGDPILLNMGSEDAPIHALQWKSRGNEVRSVLAEGIGSSLPGPGVAESGKGGWSTGKWTVVMSRTLNGPPEVARLAPGETTRIGIAVWNGTNEERAGIKAVSGDWTDFLIEA